MANYCTWSKPAGWTNNAQWEATAGSYSYNIGGQVFKNPAQLFASARLAVSTPYLFDADEFNIVCQAFPSAGGAADPIISQAAAITQLQATLSTVTADVTALKSYSGASDALASERLADQGLVWTLFLGALIVILGARKLYDLFDKAPHYES